MHIMFKIINILLIIFLFIGSDMDSGNKMEALVIPLLLFLAIGVFIYRYYKKRGHDDSSSHSGGGWF